MPADPAAPPIVGSVCNGPELRHTTPRRAALKLRVARRDRVLDKAAGEWRDGDQLFIDVNLPALRTGLLVRPRARLGEGQFLPAKC